ncbi:hypothetical protein DNTS_022149 [Danionella cerebrum]|uniref:Uncharacterized protein n=1 Tax=Danionella cerebrum TaxID=2873325 RepID=A0A553N1E4_9TELE|nr:hypothetical protein DNTS_022149 [Danionella translucida]
MINFSVPQSKRATAHTKEESSFSQFIFQQTIPSNHQR